MPNSFIVICNKLPSLCALLVYAVFWSFTSSATEKMPEVSVVKKLVIIYSSKYDHNASLRSVSQLRDGTPTGVLLGGYHDHFYDIIEAAKSKNLPVILVDISDANTQSQQLHKLASVIDEKSWVFFATHGLADGEDTKLLFPNSMNYKKLLQVINQSNNVVGIMGNTCHGDSPYVHNSGKYFFCSISTHEQPADEPAMRAANETFAKVIGAKESIDFEEFYKDNFPGIGNWRKLGISKCFSADKNSKVGQVCAPVDKKKLFFEGSSFSFRNLDGQPVSLCTMNMMEDKATGEGFFALPGQRHSSAARLVNSTKFFPGAVASIVEVGSKALFEISVTLENDYIGLSGPYLRCEESGTWKIANGSLASEKAVQIDTNSIHTLDLKEIYSKYYKLNDDIRMAPEVVEEYFRSLSIGIRRLEKAGVEIPKTLSLAGCIVDKKQPFSLPSNGLIPGQCALDGRGFVCKIKDLHEGLFRQDQTKQCCTAKNYIWQKNPFGEGCIKAQDDPGQAPLDEYPNRSGQNH